MAETAATLRAATITQNELNENLTTILGDVESARTEGAFQITAVPLTREERHTLIALGYKVIGGKNHYTISWLKP